MDRYVLAIILLVIFLPIINFSQPGQKYGTLSIDVVDENGKPVRGVQIKAVANGRSALFRGAFPPLAEINFKKQFNPRDAQESSFVATTYCYSREKFSYAINVSAVGYDPVVKAGEIRSCSESVEVVLKRNGQPIPAYEELSELRGHLTDQDRKAVTDRLSIFGDKEYVPKISAAGDYAAKLPIGVYHVLFNPVGCTEYQIRNIRIDESPKTLNLQVDCHLTQMRPDILLLRRSN